MKKQAASHEGFSIKERLAHTESEINELKSKGLGMQTEIAFAVPLQSKAVSRDWATVQSNLSRTLRSILRNTDPNFRILVAGHDMPEITELQDRNVTWLPVDFPPPLDSSGYGGDRQQKRRVIGGHLKKSGFSGYFMSLDADDWIHYRFVELIRSLPISDAFIINQGFMVNVMLKEAWLKEQRFYRTCGSSAVFYFSNDDFPITAKKVDADKTLFRFATKTHKEVVQQMEENHRNYMMINNPLVTYVLGHGDNWSVLEKKRDNATSAKDYEVQGEKLKKWFYDYFKIS